MVLCLFLLLLLLLYSCDEAGLLRRLEGVRSSSEIPTISKITNTSSARACFTWLFLSESHELPLEVTVLSASPLQPHQRYITPYSSRKAL